MEGKWKTPIRHNSELDEDDDDDEVKVKFNGLVSRLKYENQSQEATGGTAAFQKSLFDSRFFKQPCNYLIIIPRKNESRKEK